MYSNVVFVRSKSIPLCVSIYTNPLTGNSFSAYLKEVAADNYTVIFYDLFGKVVGELALTHGGINEKYILKLQNKLAGGIYRLVIQNSHSEQPVMQI